MTSSMWDGPSAIYLREAPSRSSVGNEIDDLLAMEERWAVCGGPMTFSEYESWERGEVERLAYVEESSREGAKHLTIVHPGQIAWLSPGEHYLRYETSSGYVPMSGFKEIRAALESPPTDSTGPR